VQGDCVVKRVKHVMLVTRGQVQRRQVDFRAGKSAVTDLKQIQ
jgi:hypothetical protein